MQQHNIRQDSDKEMTKGWQIFGNRIEKAIEENIINILKDYNQIYSWDDKNFNLGKVPNPHSLIPYSLQARKPVFDCKSGDGIKGAHISRARDSENHFKPIVERIITVVNNS